MSHSDSRQRPTTPQRSADSFTPALGSSDSSHLTTSAMSQSSPPQLGVLDGEIAHQTTPAYLPLAMAMDTAEYPAQLGSSIDAAYHVPQHSASGYSGQHANESQSATLETSPLAPQSRGLEDHYVDPAALQTDASYGAIFRSNLMPWTPTAHVGADFPSHRPINYWERVSQQRNLGSSSSPHVVNEIMPSAPSLPTLHRPPRSISRTHMSTPMKDTLQAALAGQSISGEQHFEAGGGDRKDIKAFRASSPQSHRNEFDVIPSADSPSQFGQVIEDSSSSGSSELLRRVSDSTYVGNAGVQARGKGRLKRGASWNGMSPSRFTDTNRHVPVAYDHAQREKEFEALNAETSGAPTRQDRRRVQNRLAQRAFRARSKVHSAEASQHTVDLEYLSMTQAQQIEQMAHVIASLQNENAQLKRILMDRGSALGVWSPAPASSHSQPAQHLF